MSDIQLKLRKAVEVAAEYEMLGSLASDPEKRKHYRELATFHQAVADRLRRELASQFHYERE